MQIQLTQQQGVPFYACDGFSGTAHGFSTRLGGISPTPWDSMNLGSNCGDDLTNVDENFRRFCRAIGADSASIVKNHQVHGCRIRHVTADDILSPPSLPGQHDADGLICSQPGLCLTVFSADCIPVLLYDPVERVIGAVHAGWRGTALGAVHRAVLDMISHYGCRSSNILAAIGPGISSCCFETHQDVPDGLRDGLGNEAEPFIRPLPESGKFSVDLKGANAHWLRMAGLTDDHIAVSDACTACDGEHFWSHRLLGTRRGSMAAMIQLL